MAATSAERFTYHEVYVGNPEHELSMERHAVIEHAVEHVQQRRLGRSAVDGRRWNADSFEATPSARHYRLRAVRAARRRRAGAATK